MSLDVLTISAANEHPGFTRIEFNGVESVATTPSGCMLTEGDKVNVASPMKPVSYTHLVNPTRVPEIPICRLTV